MIDFLMISTRPTKRGTIEIYPKFKLYPKSSDLMIRGGDFYAIWLEDRGLWSTDEQDALRLIDRELDKYVEKNKNKFDGNVKVLYMWDSESGMVDSWHKYCQKQMRDSFHMLDETLVFANSETNKNDYASKKLPYPLEAGSYNNYDKLISTLYTPEEREKIEWAIGAIVCGDSKTIQKFLVLYGAAGTGKSTILNIIQQLFEGYYSVFDAKALGSASNAFALEAFKTNPLVAMQHDGDLSKIEDNTKLNSVVSHELMTVNEKFKSAYPSRFKCFLFMGTNKPVKITDAKSGLIRRLIDVTPSGNKLPAKEYNQAFDNVKFELGAIAWHCQEVYKNDPGKYDNYVPLSMLGASNDFYNFVLDSYFVFKKEDGVSLAVAWEMYNNFCNEAKITYPFRKMIFKEELKNYFREYKDRFNSDSGSRVRSYYSGFKYEIFENKIPEQSKGEEVATIDFQITPSVFDKECSDCLAQYATDDEKPMQKWDNVKSKLLELDTSRVHYVKVPENHIVIDFDLKDENGNKSFDKNLRAASLFPPTYAELSKSEAGIHLHYIYSGDVSKLSRVYDENIEIKVFSGKSSLRRKLTKCNDLPIATISSGLPLKGEKMVNFETVKNEKSIRTLIKKNLNKEIHPGTKPSVDFIYKILEDAYDAGVKYDVTDMRNAILGFAANSSHQSEYCIKLVNKMHFKSDDISDSGIIDEDKEMVFYDIEVFPNLFLVCYKVAGEGKSVIRLINPSADEIEQFLRMKLVGFNCRRYDNHLLYARMMGYTNEQLYNLSQRIISGSPNCFFGEAYNISYTDIYDFASAGNKKSLKKLEIEMGIHHQELGLPWDEPVPEKLWQKVAEYCDNDVIATEAAFNYLSADWTARQILADLAGMTVNDTTNTLTTRIIFGTNRKPQSEFHYRNLAEPVRELDKESIDFLNEACPKMMCKPHYGWAYNDKEEVPFDSESILPYFPGYKFENGESTYRGEEVGEGGFAQGVPGMYGNVALLDISSMHPHSVIAEVLFGPKFTRAFREIVEGRVNIKHEAWNTINNMLGGKLTPYIQRVIDGEMTSEDLANALKTAINSVYGLTSASFDNPFRDPRNIDNIVAKRGALFMIDLKNEVLKRGFKVAHIKTDSIKIPDATPDIIQFVMGFGERYGYTFEHEATYDRMCLVNHAVYIAKYKDADDCQQMYGYIPGDNKKKGGRWTATGTQFQVPYVFKTLFSHEPIEFEDMCETMSVTTSLYLDLNEKLPDVSKYETIKAVRDSSNKSNLRKRDVELADDFSDLSDDELNSKIAEGHSYQFIGKVGQFSPIKAGCGGGVLLREKDGKYSAATGSKGFRWLESEMVKELHKENDVDKKYYNILVDEAADAISKLGDFEWFVSDDPYIPKHESEFMNKPEDYDEPLPFS